jgi:uncharacterized membrane protein YgcG
MTMLIVTQVIMKTFFFLRIFPTLAPIVVMLKTVVYDLRIFMLFYMILTIMFGQTFAIIGLGNKYANVLNVVGRSLKKKGGGGGAGGDDSSTIGGGGG